MATVQVQQPQQKRDLFDLLLGGLQAASAFTNIKRGWQEMGETERIKERQKIQDEQAFQEKFQQVPDTVTGSVAFEGRPGKYIPRDDIYRARSLANQQSSTNASIANARLDNEKALRDQWAKDQTTQGTKTLQTAVNKIYAVGTKAPTAAGDMSLIFNYMKMLDPNSTVREGEYAAAEQARSVPAGVLNLYNRAMTGQKLGEEQRLDFMNQAKNLYESQWEAQQNFDNETRRIAASSGINPDQIIMKWSLTPDDLNKKFEVARKINAPGFYAAPQALPAATKPRGFDANFDPNEYLKQFQGR